MAKRIADRFSSDTNTSFNALGRQSAGILDDFAVRKSVQSQTITTQDHGTASGAEVVNVCYGTSATPPTASTVPIGTIYVQYTA